MPNQTELHDFEEENRAENNAEGTVVHVITEGGDVIEARGAVLTE